MRTLHMALGGGVTLALLLGPTGAAVAQEPVVATGPENTWVTLDHQPDECMWGSPAPGYTGGEGDGFVWDRGFLGTCELTFSDPRVSGTLTRLESQDWYQTGKAAGSLVGWGSEELVGPEGTWSGWFQHIGDPEMEDRPSFHVMTGSGDYEGLTFIWEQSWAFPPGGSEPRGTGLIYEGDPPPVSGAIEPSAE
jgi:hypothetical protein